MVADEVISFKLALLRNKLQQDEFHDKFGVFTDEQGNQVSFNGSYNDSIQATLNCESIKVFCSWNDAFAALVKADAERFNRLWDGQDPNVQVFDLPEAAREQLLQLRSSKRLYAEPEWVKLRRARDARAPYRLSRPLTPSTIRLRDYQLEAINAWFAADCQWNVESQQFGYRPVLAYQSESRWRTELAEQVMDYSAGRRDFISVIVTHKDISHRQQDEGSGFKDGPMAIGHIVSVGSQPFRRPTDYGSHRQVMVDRGSVGHGSCKDADRNRDCWAGTDSVY